MASDKEYQGLSMNAELEKKETRGGLEQRGTHYQREECRKNQEQSQKGVRSSGSELEEIMGRKDVRRPLAVNEGGTGGSEACAKPMLKPLNPSVPRLRPSVPPDSEG